MTITEKNAPVVILSEYENGLALAKKVYARYELYGYVDKDKNVVIPFSSFIISLQYFVKYSLDILKFINPGFTASILSNSSHSLHF